MRTQSPKEITRLLVAWGDGDESALEGLTPPVYVEIRHVAHHHMSRERPAHTLQTTALVNEAYIRLIDWKNVHRHSRAHFFTVSAQLMRRILVDFARTRGYAKRGGGAIGSRLTKVSCPARKVPTSFPDDYHSTPTHNSYLTVDDD